MYGKKKNGGEKEAHQFFIITRIHILTYCLNHPLKGFKVFLYKKEKLKTQLPMEILLMQFLS